VIVPWASLCYSPKNLSPFPFQEGLSSGRKHPSPRRAWLFLKTWKRRSIQFPEVLPSCTHFFRAPPSRGRSPWSRFFFPRNDALSCNEMGMIFLPDRSFLKRNLFFKRTVLPSPFFASLGPHFCVQCPPFFFLRWASCAAGLSSCPEIFLVLSCFTAAFSLAKGKTLFRDDPPLIAMVKEIAPRTAFFLGGM